MDTDTLNKLDGDAVYQSVQADIVERDRKLYKQAMKNAVIRNDNAQASSDRQNARAIKTATKLNDLIDGGMEGFLAKEEEIGTDDDETDAETITRRKSAFFQPLTYPRKVRKY